MAPPDLADPITLWLVEDDLHYQSAFALLIESVSDLHLERRFYSFEPIQQAIEQGYTGPFPALVVMDIHLPGVNGVEAARQLREIAPTTEILMLTTLDDAPTLFEALRAGASGYVVKGDTPSALLDHLRQAARSVLAFSPGVARHVRTFFSTSQSSPLTEREDEVLQELAKGKSKSAIAKALSLSPHTVDTHVRSIYRKLHVSSGITAILKAVKLGILDLGSIDDP